MVSEEPAEYATHPKVSASDMALDAATEEATGALQLAHTVLTRVLDARAGKLGARMALRGAQVDIEEALSLLGTAASIVRRHGREQGDAQEPKQ